MSNEKIDTEHGVSASVVESSLGALLDGPAPPRTLRHQKSDRAKHILCGEPTGFTTDGKPGSNDVTCEKCLAILAKRRADNETRRVLRKVGARLRMAG